MNEKQDNKKIFTQRIDIYGQALAIYVFLLAIFLVFYGTLEDGEFIIVFSPLVIFILGIVCVGAFMLLLAAVKRKQIIIEDTENITIRNRFHSVNFNINDISKITINKSPSGVLKEDACFIRIKLKKKKKIMFVRVASFTDYKELIIAFEDIMKKHLEIMK